MGTTHKAELTHTYTIRASDRDGYLTAGELVERYGTSMSWIIRRQKDCDFPAAVRLGGRLRFWRLVDLLAWERGRVRE
jgi:predicted DNA-binding transcriptional regulator AlpA